jgi:hypothetical protein
MKLVTYTSHNYRPCLELTLPTWHEQIDPEDIFIFTDTDDFGERLFDEKTTDWPEGNRRKILSIKEALKRCKKNEHLLFVDTDIMMFDSDWMEVFKHNYDLVVTRIIHRDDKAGCKEVNAGVSFWRASTAAIDFCNVWLEMEAENRRKKSVKYAEQKALNDLFYLYFDGYYDLDVGVCSERKYNLEHDDRATLLKWFIKYRPTMLHLKGGLWKDRAFLDAIGRVG